MILVSGTKRSGTSLWMQVLVAAGLPFIGERFPGTWGQLFAAANPDGFWESELRDGVYWRTNPHPLTGAYLFPEQTRRHAVKVLAPGLPKTDVAFIDRCIVTVRSWREYVGSVWRLAAIVGHETTELDVLLPPALEWWNENFSMVRDIATRRYAAHVVTYDALLADPERVVHEVLGWIGDGDAAAAMGVVQPGLRTQGSVSEHDLPEGATAGLSSRELATFDALHDTIHHGRPLTPAFIQELNRTHEVLRPVFVEHQARIHGLAIERMMGDAGRRG